LNFLSRCRGEAQGDSEAGFLDCLVSQQHFAALDFEAVFLWQVMFRCHSNLKKWSIFGLNARTSSQIQALHSKNRETIDSKRLNLWSVLELVENGRH
jgi:hypothetical protein